MLQDKLRERGGLHQTWVFLTVTVVAVILLTYVTGVPIAEAAGIGGSYWPSSPPPPQVGSPPVYDAGYRAREQSSLINQQWWKRQKRFGPMMPETPSFRPGP